MSGFLVLLCLSLLLGLAYNRWTPGACCGCLDSCGFASGLNTSSVYDTSTGWTFDSAACSALGYTASGSGTAIHGTAGDQSQMEVRLGVCAGSWTLVKVWLAYTSAADSLSVEVAPSGSDYICRIRQNGNVIGTKTVTPSSSLRYLTGCYMDEKVTLSLDDGRLLQVGVTPAATGLKAGFTVTSAGGVDVDHFIARYTTSDAHPGCTTCADLYDSTFCGTLCEDGTGPAAMIIELDGAADGGCSDYAKTNHTVVANYDPTPPISGNCDWEFAYTWVPAAQRLVCNTTDCSSTQFGVAMTTIRISIGKNLDGVSPPAGKTYISVVLNMLGTFNLVPVATGGVTFELLADLPVDGFDCPTYFSGLNVPYKSSGFSGCGGNTVDMTAMTCVLSV